MACFRIKKILIKGLPGFEKNLELDCNEHLTTLIGPNGAGKTTILSVIESAFRFIERCNFEQNGHSPELWLSWSEIEVSFGSSKNFLNENEQLGNLGKTFSTFKVVILNRDNCLYIKRIETEIGAYELSDLSSIYLRSDELLAIEKELVRLKGEKDDVSRNIEIFRKSNANHPNISKVEQPRLDVLNGRIKTNEESLRTESIGFLNFSPAPLKRSALEELFKKLALPNLKAIRFGDTDFSDVKTTIKKISEIRGGNYPDTNYQEIKKQLNDLLQQDPHFFNSRDKGQDFLTINNVDYQKVSTGTKICLFYFSLVHETNPNDLILWDEPENGLHPTRRYKILDLILNDSRQFIVATHATELAPIFNKKCNVVRTLCEFRPSDGKNYISCDVISSRRDAFELADDLGLHPAKLLFTSNVAIWVEGPSDMLFWRKAIESHPEGKDLIEGFDYTFVMYGGKCISHLTAIEANRKLDILSISRHPIFIVDSDISEESKFNDIEANLKESVKVIFSEFRNDTRESGNSLFLYSLGREIENYLPSAALRYALPRIATSLTEAEIAQANISDADWPKVEKYHDMIARKLEGANIGERKENGTFSAKAYTRWGQENKTEVMKYAIEWPEFKASSLRFGGEDQVDQIISFIKRWQA